MSPDEIPRRWNHRDFYYEALHVGVSDPRVIAKACALVDAAWALSESTGLPFDSCVETILLGIISYTDLYQEVSSWKWRWYLMTNVNLMSIKWCARMVRHRVFVRCAELSTKFVRRLSTVFGKMVGFFFRATHAHALKRQSKLERGQDD